MVATTLLGPKYLVGGPNICQNILNSNPHVNNGPMIAWDSLSVIYFNSKGYLSIFLPLVDKLEKLYYILDMFMAIINILKQM